MNKSGPLVNFQELPASFFRKYIANFRLNIDPFDDAEVIRAAVEKHFYNDLLIETDKVFRDFVDLSKAVKDIKFEDDGVVTRAQHRQNNNDGSKTPSKSPESGASGGA
eukprot:Platyproteum_vivax@DN16522_c0_g1_i1.p1